MKKRGRYRAFKIAGLGLFAASVTLGIGMGMGIKAHSIAQELTNPPFYHPQPLSKVEATYQELAQGNGDDPGGTWESSETRGLQLWRLRRTKPAPGLALLLHGFGDDRWGTSPALHGFPELDAAIFTYLRRDDAIRNGEPVPAVTFGVRESTNVVDIVHALEAQGTPRNRIILMGRSLGASIGLLALIKLEAENKGPLAGIIWEGAPASSSDFAERLVRGTEDRWWHPLLAPPIGILAGTWAGRMGSYDRRQTDLCTQVRNRRFQTPALCFLATQDRLASPAAQRRMIQHFEHIEVIEVPTWHLHCAEVLGPKYSEAIRRTTTAWIQ